MASTDALFSLAGRVAVVTGANSGIGQAMAGALAEAGAAVVLVARRQSELHAATAAISKRGGQATPVVADLSLREQLADVARQCRQPFGTVEILVNAAGINLQIGRAHV